MNDAKHDVTVYDRVASTAQVSVAQVEAYLRRTGWAQDDAPRVVLTCWRKHVLGVETRVAVSQGRGPDPWSDAAASAVGRLAQLEQRQPSAVLADIAREQV